MKLCEVEPEVKVKAEKIEEISNEIGGEKK